MNHNTPKHFALQIGSLISLYLSLAFLLVLLFGIINLKFPDATQGYWAIESASSSVRLGIAMLAVFFPTYLVLTRLVNKLRRGKNAEQYLTLTKWLIYGSLTIGIGALLIDLAVIIMTFLEGEVTARFIYKAAAVLVIVGAAVHYYILDARGYWLKNESQSIMYGISAIVTIIAALSFGFAYIETPSQVRTMKLDATQLSDLQSIQWEIENVLAASSSLPNTLEEVYAGFDVPMAPEDRPAYTYEITDAGFSLCATFSNDSPEEISQYKPMLDPAATIKNANDWRYKAGKWCFDRVTR